MRFLAGCAEDAHSPRKIAYGDQITFMLKWLDKPLELHLLETQEPV